MSTLADNERMIVVGKDKLIKFFKKHSDAKSPVLRWLKTVEQSSWTSFAELKRTFGPADMLSGGERSYIIFNIGGNKYRLVTAINFKGQLVIIEIAMTHAEYSKDLWKGRL
ncbi:MAG: type II toxin-antitoxin system HigB family toxin [Phycisphaerae bacterium]|nr:type II toxin-antitoxin system HigB family toxin [Phycisphaerae bacterium]